MKRLLSTFGGKLSFKLAVVCAWAASCLPAPASAAGGFPMAPGTRWTYEGKVSCAVPQGDPVAAAGTRRTNVLGGTWLALKPQGQVYHATVRWVMEVAESFQTNGLRAAVVRAHPAELAWADFGKEPGWCVLVATSNRLVRLEAGSHQEALGLARRAVESRQGLLAEPDLKLPLKVGERWGEDTTRPDGLYCWQVERRSTEDLRKLGGPDSGQTEVFRIAYRTLPDHTVVDYAPGLGVVRYQYEHHGTVAAVDLRLRRFSPAIRGADGRPPKP